MNKPGTILDYWLGPADATAAQFSELMPLWYAGNAEMDNHIRAQYGGDLEAAERGELAGWEETSGGTLALVILFDQFSRNLYRGTPRAFSNDAAALALSTRLIASSDHAGLPVGWKLLLYHPLHHAENREAQRQVVELITHLHDSCDTAWQEILASNLKYFREHAAIIEQFGRFPHRNAILGRESTEEETAFLQQDSRTYGQ